MIERKDTYRAGQPRAGCAEAASATLLAAQVSELCHAVLVLGTHETHRHMPCIQYQMGTTATSDAGQSAAGSAGAASAPLPAAQPPEAAP